MNLLENQTYETILNTIHTVLDKDSSSIVSSYVSDETDICYSCKIKSTNTQFGLIHCGICKNKMCYFDPCNLSGCVGTDMNTCGKCVENFFFESITN